VLRDPPHRLCELYAPGLPKVALLEHTLQGLVNTRLPSLAGVLHRWGLHPTMWAAQWFLTVYTYNMPFAVVVRVWDAFACEGWKVVFRIALAALKLCEGEFLRATGFEDVMIAFRELPGRLDADALLEAAFALSLSAKDITALEEEYRAIVAAGFEHSSSAAGFGLAAHQKAKALAELRRAQRAAARGKPAAASTPAGR
jgi:hypothetical protein